jgi:hypothetical protein
MTDVTHTNDTAVTSFEYNLKCRNFYDIEFSQKATTRLCFPTCTLYVTFPTLNDNMTDYQSQSPCRHAKTVLESLFVLCVYRPHDNGIGVASDEIRKSLLCTVSASSCYRK